MDLFLLTHDEYTHLDPEILYEQIEYQHYADILSKMYNDKYDRIIITKRYIETIGTEKTLNAFKALTFMTNIFSSRLYLLTHRVDKLDKSIVDFERLGMKVLRIDVKGMTYTEFENLDKKDRVDVTTYMDTLLPIEITSIVEVLKSLDREALQQYVSLNYDKIVATILKCEQLAGKCTEIENQLTATSAENMQLLEANKSLRDSLTVEKYNRSLVEADLDKAKEFIYRYSDSIDRYNRAVLKSSISTDFCYRNKDREILVLYFKELEDIHFFKVFNEIFNNLRDIQGFNTKALVIENSQRRYFHPYKGYKSLGITPSVKELILNDTLVKYGNALKILEVLTRPKFELQILMILDRTYNSGTCIQMEKNQISYFLGTKRENYQFSEYSIPDENFISPYEGAYTDSSYLYRDTDDMSEIEFKIHCNRCKFVEDLVELCKSSVRN